MSFYVKDPATDKAVRKLAKIREVSITEVIRSLAKKALEEEKSNDVDEAAVDALIAKVASWPDTGLKADKEFYDSLYED